MSAVAFYDINLTGLDADNPNKTAGKTHRVILNVFFYDSFGKVNDFTYFCTIIPNG